MVTNVRLKLKLPNTKKMNPHVGKRPLVPFINISFICKDPDFIYITIKIKRNEKIYTIFQISCRLIAQATLALTQRYVMPLIMCIKCWKKAPAQTGN